MEKLISRKTCCVAGEFGVKNCGNTFMQSFRFIPVFVATSLIGGVLLAHADNDTPAQAAARAALQQQMNQMDNGQSAGSTNFTTPPPVAQPPAVSAPTPQFSTNVPMNSATESETAPAGMSQKNEPTLSQMQSQTNVGAMTVPPAVLNTNETEQYPVNPAMAPLPPAQVENPSTPQPAHPAPSESNPAGQQLPSAMANGMGPSIKNEPQSTNATPTFESITAPPLPISQEQQAELQNLLSQYMANQITPTQYQAQRAKVLAGQ
jgi:hypothetical protein